MSNLEFVERLPASDQEERWLVRSPPAGTLGVAWLFQDHDPEWLAAMARDTMPWLEFAHPRVSRLYASTWIDGKLAFAVDDDRGPTLAAAAAQLAGPDRERWAVAQIIAIADALTAMAGHLGAFIHRRLEPHRLFVGITGHARLRAPIADVSYGERRNYLGAGRVTGTPRWMSPEQVRGVPLTPASDVFSLASNLAFALTGLSPFARDSELDTLSAIINGPRPAIATHAPALDVAIARAFAIDPATRFPDPAAFATALRAAVPDAADYDTVMSDAIAAWWPTAPQAHGAASTELLDGRCKLAWEQLTPTDDEDIRSCDGCHQPVVRVRSLAAVLPLVGQRCVHMPRT